MLLPLSYSCSHTLELPLPPFHLCPAPSPLSAIHVPRPTLEGRSGIKKSGNFPNICNSDIKELMQYAKRQ